MMMMTDTCKRKRRKCNKCNKRLRLPSSSVAADGARRTVRLCPSVVLVRSPASQGSQEGDGLAPTAQNPTPTATSTPNPPTQLAVPAVAMTLLEEQASRGNN